MGFWHPDAPAQGVTGLWFYRDERKKVIGKMHACVVLARARSNPKFTVDYGFVFCCSFVFIAFSFFCSTTEVSAKKIFRAENAKRFLRSRGSHHKSGCCKGNQPHPISVDSEFEPSFGLE